MARASVIPSPLSPPYIRRAGFLQVLAPPFWHPSLPVLPTCFTYLSICLGICFLLHLSSSLPACLLTNLPVHLSPYLPFSSPVFIYLPNYLLTYLPTHIHTYTYFPMCLPLPLPPACHPSSRLHLPRHSVTSFH